MGFSGADTCSVSWIGLLSSPVDKFPICLDDLALCFSFSANRVSVLDEEVCERSILVGSSIIGMQIFGCSIPSTCSLVFKYFLELSS